MGEYPMSIVETTINSRKTKANSTTKFTIALSDSNTVEFRPTATFAHITTDQVLKIITKGDVDVTNENNNNKVNFKLTAKNKLLGFLNYYDNDLDNESTVAEVKGIVAQLKSELETVTIDNITLPMTAGQADDLLDEL
jgi:hypothetical protein|tara:strand:- start:259 stop:672 length:414 start_codon:yes stop_codon:yes gene_type:complete